MNAEPVIQPPGFVYFVRRGKRGPVKVGYARNPTARIAGLQTACAEPLALIGTLPGGVEDERAIHRDLAADRLSGEWFRPNRNVLSYIRRKLREHKTAAARAAVAKSTLRGAAAVERALATIRRGEAIIRERRRNKRAEEAREVEAWRAARPHA